MSLKENFEDCELVGIELPESAEEDFKTAFKTKDGNTELYNAVFDTEYYNSSKHDDPELAKNMLLKFANIDAFQKEINDNKGFNEESKKISFSLNFKNSKGEIVSADFKNVEFGKGAFTNGIDHLLSYSQEPTKIKLKEGAQKKELDNILKVPANVTKEKFASVAHKTLKALENNIPEGISPEFETFLKAYLQTLINNDKERDRQKIIEKAKEQSEKILEQKRQEELNKLKKDGSKKEPEKETNTENSNKNLDKKAKQKEAAEKHKKKLKQAESSQKVTQNRSKKYEISKNYTRDIKR